MWGIPKMGDFFHVDPVTILVLIGGFIAAWKKLNVTSAWQAQWIMKHDRECDEQRKVNNIMFGEIQRTNSHLVTLTEGHEKRLDRIERRYDRP